VFAVLRVTAVCQEVVVPFVCRNLPLLPVWLGTTYPAAAVAEAAALAAEVAAAVADAAADVAEVAAAVAEVAALDAEVAARFALYLAE
jgi:hypothetical protein